MREWNNDIFGNVTSYQIYTDFKSVNVDYYFFVFGAVAPIISQMFQLALSGQACRDVYRCYIQVSFYQVNE